MTILDDIRDLENQSIAAALVPNLTKQNAVLSSQVERLSAENRAAEGMIVLDPDKDPDPYGNFGISLVDRLHAMGWPV